MVVDLNAGVRPRAAQDRVVLRGITGFGHHGVFAHERANGQRFVVDVVCTLDLTSAAAGDDLEQTVDYGVLAADVVADIEGEPLDLIEALAERIVRTCFRRPGVENVEVTVHKPDIAMPVPVADVAVTLTRSKA